MELLENILQVAFNEIEKNCHLTTKEEKGAYFKALFGFTRNDLELQLTSSNIYDAIDKELKLQDVEMIMNESPDDYEITYADLTPELKNSVIEIIYKNLGNSENYSDGWRSAIKDAIEYAENHVKKNK